MRRRDALKLLAGAAMWPGVVRAQQLGFLWDSPSVMSDDLRTFREGLHHPGWIEGENITIEFRWAEGRFERLPELASDLVRLNVDVIVAPTSIYADAAKRATSVIPIVFATHADPIGSGHVASLARPGGNLTGTWWESAARTSIATARLTEPSRSSRLGHLMTRHGSRHPSTFGAPKSCRGSRSPKGLLKFRAIRPEQAVASIEPAHRLG